MAYDAGFRVKVHNLFEADSAPEYWGVGTITFGGGLATMTLTSAASGSSNFAGSGVTVSILNSTRIEIIRATAEFPGNSVGTPAA